jgi:hypothetical protein
LKNLVALTLLTFFFISACNSGLSNHRKHSRKYPPKDKASIEQLTLHTKIHKRKTKKYKRRTIKHKKHTKRLPSSSRHDQILLPTVIHPVSGTLMVLVDPSFDKATQLKPKQESFISPINVSNDFKKMRMFYIDHTEVTVKQYKKTNPTHNQTYITGKICAACPAMGVDWINADKHCRAVGKRLPTEAEWELAAGGSSKKPADWSNKTKRSFANLVGEEDGFPSVAPVGSFPLGADPFGALDMIGNVWEWVGTPHSPLPKNLRPKKKRTYRIVKGGGWTSPLDFATINYRNVVAGDIKNPTFGFRCVKSIN